MELQQQMLLNGQELQTVDVDNLGKGALMDDRTLAELLRLAAYDGSNVTKLILPYGQDSDSSHSTVYPSGSADAKVYVRPFRAVVGSRTVVGTDAIKNWRDIRTGVCVGGKDITAAPVPTSLDVAQVIAANSSGHARWDVIYATIAPDADTTALARAVKSPTSGTVTTPNTVTQIATKVSLGYTQGTAAASPVFPSVPVDGGGNYYVAIAYVLVPDGFGASSTVKSWMICDAGTAPNALSKSVGGSNCAPANQANVAGGQVVYSTSESAWANGSTVSTSARPNTFLPPNMIGMESVFGFFDLTGSSSAAWSHQSLSKVDDSRDWSNRMFLCFWMAQQQIGTGHFATDRKSGTTKFIPTWSYDAGTAHAMATFQYFGFGQSFITDSVNLPGSPPSTGSVVSWVGNTQLTLLDAGTGVASVALYVDHNDSGKLKVYINGTSATCLLFFWLFATRPFANY